jgi:hypothetical protein
MFPRDDGAKSLFMRLRWLCRRVLRFLLVVAFVLFLWNVFVAGYKDKQFYDRMSTMMDLSGSPLLYKEDALVTFRDEATKLQAQRCVQAGYGGIYFKHFRKTGGTTLYHILRENQCLRRQIPVFASEFPFFNTETFDVLNSTIFVTILRHPIDRIISMYWFDGRWPRTCHNACEANKTKNDTNKVANLEEWIEAIHDQSNQTEFRYVRHNGCGQWISVENYYIRMLLGVDRASDLHGAMSTKHERGFRNVTITTRHLHKAKEILASFDLVLIQEEMLAPSNKAQMFYEMTGYGANPPFSFGVKRKGGERASYFVPPLNTTLDRLRQWNALDIKLYEYAVQLSRENFEKWQHRKSRLNFEENVTQKFDAKTMCNKPQAKLPQPIANIAIGGDFCVGGRWSGRRFSDFWYFPSCVYHSLETETK